MHHICLCEQVSVRVEAPRQWLLAAQVAVERLKCSEEGTATMFYLGLVLTGGGRLQQWHVAHGMAQLLASLLARMACTFEA